MEERERLGEEGERSPEEIEIEIAGTRAAIESTVEELGERLRPGQVAEDARSYVRDKAAESASDAWRGLRDLVRENPAYFALLGGGLAALIVVRGAANGAPRLALRFPRSRRADGPRAAVPAWVAAAADRATGLGTQAAERALALTGRVRESELAARAENRMGRAREGLEAQLTGQPLLLGVASFALGAWLGGAARRR